MKSLRPLISVSLITLAVLCILNANEDPLLVEPLASQKACDGCEPFMTSGSTNPFRIKFTYKTTLSSEVKVVCRKDLIFFGDYQCAKAED